MNINPHERRVAMALLILIVALLALLIMAAAIDAQTPTPAPVPAAITPAAPCAPNTPGWRRCQHLRSQRPPARPRRRGGRH